MCLLIELAVKMTVFQIYLFHLVNFIHRIRVNQFFLMKLGFQFGYQQILLTHLACQNRHTFKLCPLTRCSLHFMMQLGFQISYQVVLIANFIIQMTTVLVQVRHLL